MATDVADLLIRIEASTAQLRTQLSQAERATQQASQAMSRSLRAVDVANDNAVRSSVNLRHALHGVSLQAQDVVVQLSAGANPLQVLIQQGGQVAGAFGPAFGPAGLLIVGVGAAALAIQSLVGDVDDLTAAADAAGRTAAALDRTLADGIDTADELATKYREMTEELRAFERVAISSAERAAMDELETVRRAIDGQVDSIRAGFRAFEAAQQNARQMFAGQITPELEAEYAAAEQVRQALEDFAAGGSATELAIALDRLAASGGEVVGPLREILDGTDGDGLIELARQANSAAETLERLNAARAILDGTATAAQREAFNRPGARSRSGGRRERTFADVLADLNTAGIKRSAAEISAAFREGEQVFLRTRTEAERYAAELARLDELLTIGAIDQETYNRAIEQIGKTTEKASRAGVQFGNIMTSAFEDAIIQGENLRSVLGGLLQDLARMGIRSGLNGLFGEGAPFGLGSLGGFVGDLFGGFFAEGGRPPMGKVSVVGEKGPELFVPDTAGTIIPNGKLGGMTFAPVYQIDARNSTLSAGEIRAIVDASSRKAVDDVRNLMNRTGSARI